MKYVLLTAALLCGPAQAGCYWITDSSGQLTTICDYQAPPQTPQCRVIFVDGKPVTVCSN